MKPLPLKFDPDRRSYSRRRSIPAWITAIAATLIIFGLVLLARPVCP